MHDGPAMVSPTVQSGPAHGGDRHVAVDLSVGMLRAWRTQGHLAPWLIQANGSRLPFADGAFDARVHRWVVEQTVALLHWFHRLRIRWEIRDDIHEAFMSLACSIICYRRLIK